MPRSNLTGGKHHKRGKKRPGVSQKDDNRVEFAEAGQVYACVKKKIGGKRILIDCSDGKERSGLIPGKFFKKLWMNLGDVLLCDLNTGNDDSICYIVHKYTPKDANILKAQGKITFDIAEDKDETVGFKFVDDNNKIAPQKNIPTIDNISSSESYGMFEDESDKEKNDISEDSNSDIDIDNL